MKVILKADVPGTGKKEQILEVSDGYARNYLLPRKLAMEATAAAVNAMSLSKAAEVHRADKKRADAMDQAKQMQDKEITLYVRAGEKGQLYGSITTQEIADALSQQHAIKVDKRKIELAEPIRKLGRVAFEVKMVAGISTRMYLNVEAKPVV